MKKIELKQIKLCNFKKHKELTIDFNSTTKIEGRNGSGKSTIFDAFCWCFFGKNSNDTEKFAINNTSLNEQRLDHSVEIILLINDEMNTFKRVLKEKYVKTRGQNLVEFKGYETSFFINSYEVSATAFNQNVSTILLSETDFKVLTNITYFNNLEWQTQRLYLNELIGGVKIEEVAKKNIEWAAIKASNIEDLKLIITQASKDIANVKSELNLIPPQIQTIEALKTDVSGINIEALEARRVELEKLLYPSAEYTQKQDKIANLKIALSELLSKSAAEKAAKKFNYDKQVLATKQSFQNVDNKISTKKLELQQKDASLKKSEAEIVSVRQHCISLKQTITSLLNDSDIICPVSNIVCDSLINRNSVKDKKAKQLENLNNIFQESKEKGLLLKSEIEFLKSEIETLKSEIEAIKAEYPVLMPEKRISDFESEDKTLTDIENLKAEIQKQEENDSDTTSLTDIREEAMNISVQIGDGTNKIETNKRYVVKIGEILEREKTLQNQLCSYEKYQDNAKDLMNAVISEIETRVNSSFKLVQFKLFNNQINGGVVETCKATLNNVDYKDCSTGEKIRIGADIITTFQKHFDTTTPVFMDNAEALTGNSEFPFQTVKLFASDSDLKFIQ